ncbi:putative pectinesterase/pectinesterase inhibitor 40 [Acorus gramineus]|uniref:Pectinesterase n=1 Tax=Acorus gramineus TaxID=55184 RepID=A0AAV9AF55_ACOGR|nr:putative pectinesterase/pectinesterase inhibitor 40 [Acorus gramineus]
MQENMSQVTVSQDGHGDFKTITEAVKSAPHQNPEGYVIKIKAGIYVEDMVVVTQSNIKFIGDGMGKTVMRTIRNVDDGQDIQHSANLAIEGSEFMAQDMTFQNVAGPCKHQAVALTCNGDNFEGYQDTLYVNLGRQFFRECEIYGTTDYIFGALASVVFQKCTIHVRAPAVGHSTAIIAQGRNMATSNAGISIHNCRIINGEPCRAKKLSSDSPKKIHFSINSTPCIPQECLDPQKTKTYLGRPWDVYSRTMVMQSFIDSLLDPAGWLAWHGNEDTCTYREYDNYGPGADTSRRVNWPDYKAIDDPEEAKQYTVRFLIQGEQWLSATGVPFDLDLK